MMIARAGGGAYLLVLALLCGCASLSERDCDTANWAELGERDAYNGRGRERLAEHREACARHGVAPDPGAYNEGWDKGIRLYCTPQRGYEIGQSGAAYAGTCPPALERDFMRGHQAGRAIYRELSHAQRIRSEIRGHEAKLGTSEDPSERETLRHRVRLLDEELGMIQRRVRRLQDDAAASGLY